MISMFSTRYEREMGLILPSGCMKADIGSQVASDNP